MLKNSKLILTLIHLLLINHYLYSQTYFSGIISTNTTWLVTGSPYIITGNVLVDNNKTLTIEPGVVVKFENGKTLQIRGTLRSIGTKADKIIFTSNDIAPTPGSWIGIEFLDASTNYNFTNSTGNILKNTSIEYAINPINLQQCSAYIDSCSFSYNSDLIINAVYGDPLSTTNKLEISNNVFLKNGGSSIYVNGTFFQTSIHDNIFCGNNSIYTIMMGSYSTNLSEIYQNVFANNNGSTFITIFPFNIHNNTFTQNIAQINSIAPGAGNFNHNTITQNFLTGPTPSQSSTILVTDGMTNYCNVFNNSGNVPYYDIENYNSISSPNQDSRFNWFGTTDINLINDFIFDWFDDPSKAVVNFQPLLISADTLAPISPPYKVEKIDLGFGDILLKWENNPEDDLKGYKIHFGTTSNYTYSNTIDVGKVNQFLLSGPGFADTIVVTAYDNDTTGIKDLLNGHESWYSKPADSVIDCSAFFLLSADTIPQHYIATNYSVGNNPMSYSWDWGDGSPVDTTAYPSHIYSTPGNYTICLSITDNSGCTDTICSDHSLNRNANSMLYINVIPPMFSGLTNPIENLISIYPNPTKDQLNIKLPDPNGIYETKITTAMGVTIFDNKLNRNTPFIDISNLNSGIYFIELVKGDQIFRKSFIKL